LPTVYIVLGFFEWGIMAMALLLPIDLVIIFILFVAFWKSSNWKFKLSYIALIFLSIGYKVILPPPMKLFHIGFHNYATNILSVDDMYLIAEEYGKYWTVLKSNDSTQTRFQYLNHEESQAMLEHLQKTIPAVNEFNHFEDFGGSKDYVGFSTGSALVGHRGVLISVGDSIEIGGRWSERRYNEKIITYMSSD